ncbi:hypothetical protein McpSp1_08220 [Methanocorpusculaceae archaeon Sp1]|uniref:Transposase IS30-like HTH domain-containing protein n=1 Tax=Methanorbis furvi TaxID=3028299 RepID=A0AAE4S9R4_9EURY|nr:hypothetical protein [Methanocorpusculaceae archaeon Sp1]MDV0441456.1 hypothetical protein [Methanocorpusculaceae archaeon Ag1]
MVWRDHPDLCDRKVLKRQLFSGMTVEEIALRNGCTRGTVRAAMHHHRLRRPLVQVSEKEREILRL